MNQQVNLYLPELRPRRDWLTASRLRVVVLTLVVIMAAISGYDYWRLSRLESEQSALQASVTEQVNETERLEREVAQRSGNERLQRELETRQTRLQRSRNLLEFLENTRPGNTEGFSSMMKDLSRASFEGLWLTEILIRQGGSSVMLRGAARQPAMVPDFIGRLSNGESQLRQRRFNRFVGTRTAESDEAVSETGAEGDRPGYRFELEAR